MHRALVVDVGRDNRSVEFTLPGVKTSRSMDCHIVLVDTDADVLVKLITHRRQLAFDFPFLFVNKFGGKVTCDSISRMLCRLGQTAGYGTPFAV